MRQNFFLLLIAPFRDRPVLRCASIFVLLCLAFCGGNRAASAPGSASTAGSPSAAPADPPLAEKPADSASPAAASASSASSAPLPAPTTAPSSTSFVSSEAAPSQDECGKVAGPFEERARARMNECYQAGKKKNPELAGTIRIVVTVNVAGKVTSMVPVGTSELGSSVVDCMVKAVKREPFDGSACKGKTVAMGKTYGKK